MKVLQMPGPSDEKKALPQAVIFDLDGTLVDTAPDLAGALNHCLDIDGHAPFEVSQMRGLVGRGAAALLKRGYTIRGGREPSEEKLDTLRATFLDYYRDHIADDSRPFDGVEAVLDTLKSRGIPLGVCTNKPHEMAVTLLGHLGWGGVFGCVVGGDLLGFKKPDPRHVFAVSDTLNVNRDDCVFVGDSEVDYEAAQAANMRMILVSFGYSNVPLAEMPAAICIDHYREFMEALKRV